MKELFGIPTTTIAMVLVVLFAVSIATVAWVFVSNRTMFKMGLRNLPRRRLQTGLIVLGVMLATLIITAAFTTGDTVDYSVTNATYEHWQRTDLTVNLRGPDSEDGAGADVYVPETVAQDLQAQFPNDPDIELFVPFLFERVAVRDEASKLSEPAVTLVGIDAEGQNQVGALRSTSGGRVDLTTLGPTDALLSKRAASDMDAKVGDTLAVFVQGEESQVTVVGIVRDEQASGVIGNFDDATRAGGMVMALSSVQELTGHPDEINYLSVSLKGDVRSTAKEGKPVAERLQSFLAFGEGKAILGLGDQSIGVDPVKQDDVEEAEFVGNLFTTFFLVVGLFSIAAGIMLIFMIFVMLAAERKPEMGMARAVGAQRSSLVQSFLAEGMSYNLIAGVIGTVLGVGAALGLVVGFLRLSLGDDFGFIQGHVSTTSLIISYCLGVVITFITVVASSIMVSSVNIVSAIRGTPEDETPEPRRGISWRSVVLGVPALIVPPLGLWLILRKGFGISWAWICGPAGIALGALCIFAAKGNGSEFLFSLGFSILPLSLAILAAHYRTPPRLTWTLVGLYLAAYWMSPVNIGEKLLNREMNGDIEMFVLSGVMVVIAFTLIIVFNARLLTALFQRSDGGRYRLPAGLAILAAVLAGAGVALGDRGDGVGQLCYLVAGLLALTAAASWAAARFPRFAPALKMGVAYPLSNRFRTGMTIAMFSLIIFSLTTFSAVNANFSAMITGEESNGGWDIIATANSNNELGDVQRSLREADAPEGDQIEAVGRTTTYTGAQEVRQGSDDWSEYPVIAGDDIFLLPEDAKLDARANIYLSDRAAIEAMRLLPDLALIDWYAKDANNSDGAYDFTVDADFEDGSFEPFKLEVRDPTTGNNKTVTVVGVLPMKIQQSLVSGVYVSQNTYEQVFGEPNFDRAYIRLDDGVNAKEAARGIESTLSTQGLQADSIRALIDETQAQDKAFTRMFQAFMALGLFVGIAALGVIAFRSVVERRQQIGMMRAIGYQSSTVALTFVLESSFVALMGILSGVVGGVIVSRNLFTTGQFSGEGIEFTIPWTEVMLFVVVSFVVSLVMTWLPSRAAAGVPVADALRYE